MNRHFFLCILTAGLLTVFGACDNRNIHQVVKAIAEAPVDTTGFTPKVVQTNAFSGVEIDCFADATFHQTPAGTAPYVRLMAIDDVLSHVSVKTADDMLFISTDRRYRMPEKAVIVIDIYAPFISKVTLNGGKCLRLGRLQLSSPLMLEVDGVGALTADSLAAHEISVHLDGSGSVDLRGIVTRRLNATLTDNGTIYLAGTTEMTNFAPGQKGHIDTTRLKTIAPAAPQP